MNIQLIGGISFGILGIYYSVYLYRDWIKDQKEKSHLAAARLIRGIGGAATLFLISIFCFYEFHTVDQ
ncbi:hypothetical protein [Moheibacter lacus]|uniref:Uncharacterized protein n=1 Tax=Moheibacter lacus TaxID=2745851 RepID=A0A838ZNV3_9FLAO|nr:hypothetical protein [Moheibacter lacus]MBA5629426.1 hypothetical protein [Moheibacter lacus]